MADMKELRRLARQAMLERGFLPEFSRAATDQAQRLDEAIPDGAIPDSVRDLRKLPWISIDNDESLDLDQLATAEALADGTRLRVAIADVDARVPHGSPIDDHARTNTTSIYTAAQIFPMLPERLSTDLTSLADRSERLAVIVEMIVTPDGAIAGSTLYRALVFNHAKLAYNSISAWLDGGELPERLRDMPHLQEQVRIQEAASNALRNARAAHGAMSLETTQAETVFTGGVLSDMRPATKNRARETIEDQMIAANGVTARFLEERGFASIRRILHTPRRWDRIVALAASFGDRLPQTPDVIALSTFMQRRRQADPARYADVSLSIIKMLGSGEYGVDVPGEATEGHFGLAVNDYTHSTAPNRRFPDLVTQRLLKAALAGTPSPYDVEALRAIASHCTKREDDAGKVERQVRKSAAAMLLQSRIGQEFDAIVTGAADKGTWVRIHRPAVEGKVVRGAAGLDVGDRARVRLIGVNVERGFIDFAAVND